MTRLLSDRLDTVASSLAKRAIADDPLSSAEIGRLANVLLNMAEDARLFEALFAKVAVEIDIASLAREAEAERQARPPARPAPELGANVVRIGRPVRLRTVPIGTGPTEGGAA